MLAQAKELGKQLLLPVDIVVAVEFRDGAASHVINYLKAFLKGMKGWICGPKRLRRGSLLLQKARTIFWNGPVGVFQFPSFAIGTKGLAQIVASCKGSFSIVGGGDSIAALEQAGLPRCHLTRLLGGWRFPGVY